MAIPGLRDTLLQVLLVLFPALLMEMGKTQALNPGVRSRRLIFLCTLSMLLCMAFAFPIQPAFIFDMKAVPYLIGILYGGYRSGLLLTLFYLIIQLYMLRGAMLSGELPWFMFLILHMVLIITAYFMKRRFDIADFPGKLRVAVGISAFATVITVGVVLRRKFLLDLEVTDDFYMILFIFSILKVITTGIIVKLMEGIQDKVRLQQRLLEEARKLQLLIDALPTTVIAIDRDERITIINDTTMAYYPGLQKEELIGKPYRELTKAYRIDSNKTYLIQALHGEYIQAKIDNYHDRTFLITAFPLRNMQEEITGAVTITLEITELIQLRKELGNMERLSLVGQMAASITHEIRNPMAVIRGFMQLLHEKREITNESYYRVIQEELDRANAIIDDFLSLAQNRIVEKQPADLNGLIHQLEPLVSAEANLRGHCVRYQLSDAMPPLLLNEKEMKQLLLNLVRNAMEAMEDGAGTVTIETHSRQDTVQLQVSDTGRGMSEDVRAKLFEPFFTTKQRGTGLGLAVCLSIVEHHEGEIRVESEKGKGTSFIISFPNALAAI